MTDKEIIETLARRMDWKNVSRSRNGLNWFGIPPGDEGSTKATMPDWLNSLDALQPVLAKLTEGEKIRLDIILWEKWKRVSKDLPYMILALTLPPRELAEAITEAIKEGE